MFISKIPQIYKIAVVLNINTAPEKNNEKILFLPQLLKTNTHTWPTINVSKRKLVFILKRIIYIHNDRTTKKV